MVTKRKTKKAASKKPTKKAAPKKAPKKTASKSSASKTVRAKKVIRDSLGSWLTKPAVGRLFYIASLDAPLVGAHISSLAVEEFRGNAKVFLENFLQPVITITEHNQRKTINTHALKHGATHIGRKIYTDVDPEKAIVAKTKKEITSYIKKRKSYQLTVTSDAGFRRAFKEVIQDNSDGLNVSKDALMAAKIFVEVNLINMLKDGLLVAKNAGRLTLKPQDMQVTRKICRG